MFNWNKKETPLLGLQGSGGGLGRLAPRGSGAISASGGSVTDHGTIKVHEFTPSTPSPQRVFTVTGGSNWTLTAIVLGGGGGGGISGGGGGAGGAAKAPSITVTSGDSSTVTLGGGGNGSGPGWAPDGGTPGGDTYVNLGGHQLTAKGGGKGAHSANGYTGGCAGGQGGQVPSYKTPPNQPTANPGAPYPITAYGDSGGQSGCMSNQWAGAGGGGLGSPGSNAGCPSNGGPGGVGMRLADFHPQLPTQYVGGGGGGGSRDNQPGGSGGAGGGGNGTGSPNTNGQTATSYGAGGGSSGGPPGGKGGPGSGGACWIIYDTAQ